ncbi:MAG: DNA mismatch repair protein MutS [Deltaproteobacteria bacterium]|nr:DNA mismatch repair protein MutS [Deltaproteobacteria bacterium]MBI3390980.1 DNA mismatch repair protein MutS [Deltaproteobacteria bacterium]
MTATSDAAPDSISADSEYRRRRDVHLAIVDRQAQRDRQLSRARLLIVCVAVLLGWAALSAKMCSAWWLLVPLAGFVGLVVAHHRVRSASEVAQRIVAFYARGLARVEHRWMGGGETGERFHDDAHLYAADLDLFGRGSLFELLCTARTRAGEETLAAWLRTPADLDVIRARQTAIAELRPLLDLREALAVLGRDVRDGMNPDALAKWGAAPSSLSSHALRVGALALVSCTLVTLAGWGLAALGPRWFALALLAQTLFGWTLRDRVLPVLRAIDRPARDLALLSHLLARIERERFSAPRLVALQAALATGGVQPSRQIARLRRWVDLLYARNNELFAPASALLLWATQCALAIEAWRASVGPAIAQWIAVVGEMEALCALASYSYEHPSDPFPELVMDAPRFEAEGLGHPLLAEARCVRNDVHLGGAVRALIVSGSNMSGKSTLLRAVGINAVLAQMGAPVRARHLSLSSLAVGASIRINDSLQAGTSRFYAEILRLRQLVDLAAGARPLLFLLDEILHGTNSHDRRIGAEALVKGLLAHHAIGLVTTHDLALAEIADGAQAINVHFEDHIENGQMQFDYRMRLGVVEKSNALELMRAVGLDV